MSDDPRSRVAGPSVALVAMGGEERASSRMRVHGWVPHLEAAGFAVSVYTYHRGSHRKGDPFGWLARLSPRLSAALRAPVLWRELIREAGRVGWIVFQQVLPPERVLRALRARGARIGYDFSDPVQLANGPHHRARHRVLHRLTTLPRLRGMLRNAEWITIENDLLVDLAGSQGAAVKVMRGPVDDEVYRPAGARNGRTVVGWAGSDSTLPLMLPILEVLEELAAEGLDFECCLFGVREQVAVHGVDVRVLQWSRDDEARVISGFDIGINHAPLDGWTRFRGGAKLIFYQSCGIPTVSSPSGIGDQVVEAGSTGFLAATREEWKARLRWLISDADLRRRMGESARERAVSSWSYRAYLPEFVKLLSA